MGYIYFTNVPNIIFDTHLKDLGYAELKILLVIIRQTYGWKDKHTGWTSYIRLDIKLGDLELHQLTLNYEKTKQELQFII